MNDHPNQNLSSMLNSATYNTAPAMFPALAWQLLQRGASLAIRAVQENREGTQFVDPALLGEQVSAVLMSIVCLGGREYSIACAEQLLSGCMRVCRAVMPDEVLERAVSAELASPSGELPRHLRNLLR